MLGESPCLDPLLSDNRRREPIDRRFCRAAQSAACAVAELTEAHVGLVQFVRGLVQPSFRHSRAHTDIGRIRRGAGNVRRRTQPDSGIRKPTRGWGRWHDTPGLRRTGLASLRSNTSPGTTFARGAHGLQSEITLIEDGAPPCRCTSDRGGSRPRSRSPPTTPRGLCAGVAYPRPPVPQAWPDLRRLVSPALRERV